MTTNYKKGDSDTRPWGTWEVLESANNYCVKKITVKPNAILSLQMHNFRAEHWIIAKGEAMIVLGEDNTGSSNKKSIISLKVKKKSENVSHSVISDSLPPHGL